MGFIEKVKRAVTGKTYEERQQEKYAMREIRKKVMAEALQERQTQAIAFAREREKVAYARRTEALKAKPRQGGFFTGAASYYGVPPKKTKPAKSKYKTVYVKKGKHYKKKRVLMRPKSNQQQITQPARYDVLGSMGGFTGSSGGYRVI